VTGREKGERGRLGLGVAFIQSLTRQPHPSIHPPPVDSAGIYISASGASYEGDFSDGKFHGEEGVYRWPDGAIYRGQWSGGKMHGQGAFTGADGLQFVGVFYNGLYVDGKTHVAVR
jgi:hypothetical protein